eukprot:7171259-Pyramimonas_sp.AAC.1
MEQPVHARCTQITRARRPSPHEKSGTGCAAPRARPATCRLLRGSSPRALAENEGSHARSLTTPLPN